MSCNMPDFSVKKANLDTSESPVAGKRKSSSASGSSRRGKKGCLGTDPASHIVLENHQLGVAEDIKQTIESSPKFEIETRGPKQMFYVFVAAGTEPKMYFPREEIKALVKACYIYLSKDLNSEILSSRKSLWVIS